jgi:type 2A phosphatase activator TIP41
LTLFEDELHDNGISNLSIKLRAMPSGFFILLRHALRVDHVMARICDTRIHYEVGNDYFLRQFQVKQESFKNLGELDPHQFSDINALAQLLPVREEVTEKVMLIV